MSEKNRLRALKAWRTIREKKKLGAVGSLGIYTYLQTLDSVDRANAMVRMLADLYRTKDLLKLKASFRKNLDELERIGMTMEMIEIDKEAR